MNCIFVNIDKIFILKIEDCYIYIFINKFNEYELYQVFINNRLSIKVTHYEYLAITHSLVLWLINLK